MAVLFSLKLHSTNFFKCCHCDKWRMIQYPYIYFHYFICKIQYIFTFIDPSYLFYFWISCLRSSIVSTVKVFCIAKKLKKSILHICGKYIFSFMFEFRCLQNMYISFLYSQLSFHVKFYSFVLIINTLLEESHMSNCKNVTSLLKCM